MHPLPNLNRFFHKFPVLELERITLRDLMLSDSLDYLKMLANPEVVKYFSDEDIPQSFEEAQEEIKFWSGLFYRKKSIFWAIANRANKLIGSIGYNSWNFYNRRAEISYDLDQNYWRQGIMSEALKAVLNFGFNEMGLMRIEARTMIDNLPSQAILEKLGFKLEGKLYNYRIIRGEPVDVLLYSLIP